MSVYTLPISGSSLANEELPPETSEKNTVKSVLKIAVSFETTGEFLFLVRRRGHLLREGDSLAKVSTFLVKASPRLCCSCRT